MALSLAVLAASLVVTGKAGAAKPGCVEKLLRHPTEGDLGSYIENPGASGNGQGTGQLIDVHVKYVAVQGCEAWARIGEFRLEMKRRGGSWGAPDALKVWEHTTTRSLSASSEAFEGGFAYAPSPPEILATCVSGARPRYRLATRTKVRPLSSKKTAGTSPARYLPVTYRPASAAHCSVRSSRRQVPLDGDLTLSVSGLPAGTDGVVVVRGSRTNRRLTIGRSRTLSLPAGHYTVIVERVSVGAAGRGIEAGAVAYPAKRKLGVTVKAGGTKTQIRYAGVVNPSARPLPDTVLGVVGDPEDPQAVLLPGGGAEPKVGTIFVGAPSAALPRGLVAKVTTVQRRQEHLIVGLESVSISEAVPAFEFVGSLDLAPAPSAEPSAESSALDKLLHPGARSAGPPKATASGSACSPPKLVKFGAHLDSLELRQAFVDAFPPQMRLTLAVRTTESLGVAAAAVGINCDWKLAELGPYQTVIPVGPIPVPVYATLPVNAGIHVNGRLDVGTVNLASTTVATTNVGTEDNQAGLSEQGSNVWTSGFGAISGSAKLSASVGVQAGIGVAKGANVHLTAGFGPEFDWSTGHECELRLDLGSLSAGVSILGKDFNTPSFTPLHPKLWHGCPPAAGGGGSGSGGGSGGSPGGGDKQGTGPAPSPGGGGVVNPDGPGILETSPSDIEAGQSFGVKLTGTCPVGSGQLLAMQIVEPGASFDPHKDYFGTGWEPLYLGHTSLGISTEFPLGDYELIGECLEGEGFVTDPMPPVLHEYRAPLNVIKGPTALSIQPSTVHAGGTVVVTPQAPCAGPNGGEIKLSLSSSSGSESIPLGNANGNCEWGPTNVSIPSNLKPGTYYVDVEVRESPNPNKFLSWFDYVEASFTVE